MNGDRRAFLDALLESSTPSGYERPGQRVWVGYVRKFADEVRTDACGNAVAAVDPDGDGPSVAFAGHVDGVGYVVRSIDDDGSLHPEPVGRPDHTVSRGQHVEVHAEGGPVAGVVGQRAIHVRDADGEDPPKSRSSTSTSAPATRARRGTSSTSATPSRWRRDRVTSRGRG